jgi:uncharacterized protein YaiE (UPF0345 family)
VEEHAVELRYFSGWETPTIHACVTGQEWSTWSMERDGEWLVWKAPVPEEVPADNGALAEFVITDGNGDWDKPQTGDNYVIPAHGVWELRNGELTPASG